MRHRLVVTLLALGLWGCQNPDTDAMSASYNYQPAVRIQDTEILIEDQDTDPVIERLHADGFDGSTSDGISLRPNNNRYYFMTFVCRRTKEGTPEFDLSFEVGRSFESDEVQVTIRIGNNQPVTETWQIRGESNWWASPPRDGDVVRWVGRIIKANNRKIEVWIKEAGDTADLKTYAFRFENRGPEFEEVGRFIKSEHGCGHPILVRQINESPE